MDYSKSVKEFPKYKTVRVRTNVKPPHTTQLPSPNTTKKCLNFNSSYASITSESDPGIPYNQSLASKYESTQRHIHQHHPRDEEESMQLIRSYSYHMRTMSSGNTNSWQKIEKMSLKTWVGELQCSSKVILE